MRRVLMTALLIAASGFLAGCPEGEGEGDPFFKVVIEVEDTTGRPVPGLNLELTSDNPYLQDFRASKARMSIQFTVPRPARGRVVVEDIKGKRIRDLIDGMLMAGRYEVVWDAKDYDGVHQPSGRYTIRLTGFNPETGQPEFEDTTDVLMCLVDPYYNPIGVTDENGRIVLKDKRHFPHLYNRDPMMAHDENADELGLLEPTADMIVALVDTAGGGTMIFREKIPRRGIYRFVWNERSTQRDRRDRPPGPLERGADIPPPVGWQLGPAYPNPFN